MSLFAKQGVLEAAAGIRAPHRVCQHRMLDQRHVHHLGDDGDLLGNNIIFRFSLFAAITTPHRRRRALAALPSGILASS